MCPFKSNTTQIRAKNFQSCIHCRSINSVYNNQIKIYFTDFGPVNTGAALWFAYNNIFGQEGDRPNAVNVLALDTDNNADDDVIEPARALRAAGVVVRVFLSNFNQL